MDLLLYYIYNGHFYHCKNVWTISVNIFSYFLKKKYDVFYFQSVHLPSILTYHCYIYIFLSVVSLIIRCVQSIIQVYFLFYSHLFPRHLHLDMFIISFTSKHIHYFFIDTCFTQCSVWIYSLYLVLFYFYISKLSFYSFIFIIWMKFVLLYLELYISLK